MTSAESRYQQLMVCRLGAKTNVPGARGRHALDEARDNVVEPFSRDACLTLPARFHVIHGHPVEWRTRRQTTAQHVEKTATVIGQGEELCRVGVIVRLHTRHQLRQNAVHATW